jgi:flagellar motility protein MotE (MotC chaperone)
MATYTCPSLRYQLAVAAVADRFEETTDKAPSGTPRTSVPHKTHIVAIPAVAITVATLVCVKLIQRSFKRLETCLRDKERRCEELSAECLNARGELEAVHTKLKEQDQKLCDLIEALEEKTKELEEKERSLVKLQGDLGLSKSMTGMVERELKATKKLLSSYQGQLDQATHVLRESNRENENANTPGAFGFHPGGLWN